MAATQSLRTLLRALARRLLPGAGSGAVHKNPIERWVAEEITARVPTNKSGNNASVR